MGAGHIPTFVHTKLPMTSASLLRHLRRLPGALCFLAPMLIEDALREPSVDYDVLKTTKRIFVGGAALNRALGKQLIEMGVPIVQVYGSWVQFDNLGRSSGADVLTGLKSLCLFSLISLDLLRRGPKMCLMCVCVTISSFFTGNHSMTSSANLSYPCVCFEHLCATGIWYSHLQKKITAPAVLNHRDPIGFATNDLWERHPTIPGKVRHFVEAHYPIKCMQGFSYIVGAKTAWWVISTVMTRTPSHLFPRYLF